MTEKNLQPEANSNNAMLGNVNLPLTKQEAIAKMLAGEKVSHRYFTDYEYIFMKPNDFNIYSEDGVNHGDTFWSDRIGNEWETDWQIYVA